VQWRRAIDDASSPWVAAIRSGIVRLSFSSCRRKVPKTRRALRLLPRW
jgi:hypothetical protein